MNGGISIEEKDARLKHLQWPAVRALYGAALRELEEGHRKWSDPLHDLKEEMLKPSDVLHVTVAGSFSKEAEVCKGFNYGLQGCSRGAKCSYRHVCEECWKQSKKAEAHRAKSCPHKEENTPNN